MIDRNARNLVAEAVRHYLSGLSTNFVFDDSIMDISSNDAGIKAVREQLWLIYDDLKEHRHGGKWKLSDEQREIVLRIILFLKSDFEYQWPETPRWYSFTRPLIWLLTFSLGTKRLDHQFKLRDSENVWPFQNQNEIESAKREPEYLASAR